MDTRRGRSSELHSGARPGATIRRRSRIRELLRPGDVDMPTLLALRAHQDLTDFEGSLERLQALGCIDWENDYPVVTQRGLEALRRWLT